MLPAWLLTGLGVALDLPQLSSASVQGLPPTATPWARRSTRPCASSAPRSASPSWCPSSPAPPPVDALDHFHRAWWMVIACGTLTSVVAVALALPAGAVATPRVASRLTTWRSPLPR